MKIREIVDARPSLQKLAAQDLTIKTLYKVSKMLDKLDSELIFYNEQKNKILSKYCDIVGNQYVPREENREEIDKELGELLDLEIEGNIEVMAIGDNENIKLSYNDLVALRKFVRIEGED